MDDDELDSTYTTIEGVPYVRLFVDHGESPIWTWEPLDYDELQLPPELEARLRAWETAYYQLESGPSSPDPAAQRYRADGILLAGQLAGELGAPLAVHYAPARPDAPDAGGYDDVEGSRPSLADPEVFHVDTFPVRPAVTRRIAWLVQHPFEQPDDTAGPGPLDADWDDLPGDDDGWGGGPGEDRG